MIGKPKMRQEQGFYTSAIFFINYFKTSVC